jgi:hypothetical protein
MMFLLTVNFEFDFQNDSESDISIKILVDFFSSSAPYAYYERRN